MIRLKGLFFTGIIFLRLQDPFLRQGLSYWFMGEDLKRRKTDKYTNRAQINDLDLTRPFGKIQRCSA